MSLSCFEATSANQVSKPCYTDGKAGSLSANAGPRFFDTFWEWWCTPDTPDSPSSTGSEPECGSGSECGFGSECDDEVIQCLINAKSSANQVCKLSYTSSSETIDIAEITGANQVCKLSYTSSSETIDIAEITDSDGEAGPSFWNTFWEWWCTPDTPDSPSPSP